MKRINKIIVFALAIAILSCDDILEKDITDDRIQNISPVDEAVIESNVVHFQWNNLKGADQYRIQIQTPDQSIILDSLLGKTHLTYPLHEGSYQWTVRGENFAYQSAYSYPTRFSTIISDDLTNQLVILTIPQDNKFVNFTNVSLNWQVLAKATTYSLEVTNTSNGQQVYFEPELTETTVTLNVPDMTDAAYLWKVKAKNSTSETQTYASRKFSIDTVIPNQPENSTPEDNSVQIIDQQINFTWTSGTDSGNVQSPVSYIIEFSNNENFTTIIQSSNSNSATLQQTFSKAGIYFWRVRAKDGAGNIGTNGTPFKFTIN